MDNIKLDDTIAAISTPIGEGGIGIVRLSGRDALKILDKIFLSKNNKKPTTFKSYTLHYGHIVEKQKKKAKEKKIVDEVILSIMRSPRSYTKEDVVEVNCHSGIAPLKKILDLVLINGARLAKPGEFTKRAFLNGRIDLLQAESVLDIIRAKTDLSLKAALNNLGGLFSRKINNIIEKLMNVLSHIEACIDFSEEDSVDKIKIKNISSRLKHAEKDVEKLISTAYEGKILRQGIKTVICGSPNVGKSSLMNAILRESRAIVTHLPGTTRDTIEEIVNIKGVPVLLTDTAGINKTDHPVEKEGVKRSHSSIQSSDLILQVLDYSRKLKKGDFDIMRNIKDREIIVVINKMDLKKCIDIKIVKKFFPGKPIMYISAIKSLGIDKLEKKVKEVIFKGKVPTSNSLFVSNNRQLDMLRRALKDIKEAINAIKERISMDCVAVYVRSSIKSIGEVTGHTITERALDRIFSEFCIGK